MAAATLPNNAETSLWTPRLQHMNSRLKPVRLLELGVNDKGRYARVEFDDESSRPLYLQTIEDAFHPLFMPLGWDDMFKIQAHFRARHDRVRLPCGNIKVIDNLFFMSETMSPRRKYLGHSYFDVPAEDYFAGTSTGIRAADEFIQSTRVPDYIPGRRPKFANIWRDLTDAARDGKQGDASRAYAAHAFLSVISDLVDFAARNAEWKKYIDFRINRLQEEIAKREAWRQEAKVAFVERMKAARAAKRQAAQAEPESESQNVAPMVEQDELVEQA